MDSQVATPSWGDSWQAIEARRKAGIGEPTAKQRREPDIRLRQIRPDEFRVYVNGGGTGENQVARYHVTPDVLETLFRCGYRDGSKLGQEFFESLRRDGKFYQPKENSAQDTATHEDIGDRIAAFFQSMEFGLSSPDSEAFRNELLTPIMGMGGGSIRDQYLLQLSARLKESYGRSEGSHAHALCGLADALCETVPASLKQVVEQTLAFRSQEAAKEETEQPARHHVKPMEDLSKRAIVLDMLKVLELETQNLRQAITESPELIGDGASIAAHPMAKEQFLALVESLAPPARDLARQSPIAVVGDGPWSSKLVAGLMAKRGAKTSLLTRTTSCVVVGASGVDVEALRNWLTSRDGEGTVYPQELLLLYLLTGKDPLPEIDEVQATHWINYHPVLADLFGPGDDLPPWPAITEGSRDESFDDKQDIIQLLRGESPLAKMGYSVRKSERLGPKRRRDILRRAFEGKIPRVDPQKGIETYMAQWGNPATSQRLWRIARHLAGQINLKRPNQLQARAVGLWREDLEWLHQELYPRIRFRFAWPRIFGG